jgi:hypothetical protein
MAGVVYTGEQLINAVANLREFSYEFEMAPMGYSGAHGELINEKT